MAIKHPGLGAGPVDDCLTIIWQDEDLDDDATITLFYDTDNAGQDGVVIQGTLSENDSLDHSPGIPVRSQGVTTMSMPRLMTAPIRWWLIIVLSPSP